MLAGIDWNINDMNDAIGSSTGKETMVGWELRRGHVERPLSARVFVMEEPSPRGLISSSRKGKSVRLTSKLSFRRQVKLLFLDPYRWAICL